MPESAETSVDDLNAELLALQARSDELERRGSTTSYVRVRNIARSSAAAILIVVGVIALTLAPVAIWGRNLVLDTDRYVATIAPVSSDPGVQNALIAAVDRQVESHLDVAALAHQVLPPRAAHLLAGPLQSAAEGLVNQVTTRFVRSDAFSALWETVNRAAHQQITYLLTGDRPADAAVDITGQGKIILNLAPIVAQIKQRLVASGLTVAKNVPAVGATLELADASGLVKAQRFVRALNALADWLPWVGVVLAASGILIARRRRRVLIASAFGLGVGMLLVGAGLLVGRNYYLAQVPVAQLPRETAAYLFDTIVRFLRWGIRVVLVVTLLVALGAWVSGPGSEARRLRTVIGTVPRALGARLHRGWFGTFAARYARALRIGIIALVFVVLVLVDVPTLGLVILLAVVGVLLLLVVEMLRSAGGHTE